MLTRIAILASGLVLPVAIAFAAPAMAQPGPQFPQLPPQFQPVQPGELRFIPAPPGSPPWSVWLARSPGGDPAAVAGATERDGTAHLRATDGGLYWLVVSSETMQHRWLNIRFGGAETTVPLPPCEPAPCARVAPTPFELKPGEQVEVRLGGAVFITGRRLNRDHGPFQPLS